MLGRFVCFTWLGCYTAVIAPAVAADPVAMIEDIAGTPAGVRILDYLSSGTVIQLDAKQTLVIDYFRSCVRETITGGSVTIGTERSDAIGGVVHREKVECDGGHFHLTAEQAAKSGTVVFRAPPRANSPATDVVIERTLYGLSPLIEMYGPGILVIERLDQQTKRLEINVPASRLLHESFYDLAKARRSLAAGGIYRASANGRSVVFRIDTYARGGDSPLLGRLLKL